ncbi:hypothetical protein [Pseudoponticoccus marisrubri]|nr:hypothetical protein [Pseudoponticoccus marisrubri]
MALVLPGPGGAQGTAAPEAAVLAAARDHGCRLTRAEAARIPGIALAQAERILAGWVTSGRATHAERAVRLGAELCASPNVAALGHLGWSVPAQAGSTLPPPPRMAPTGTQAAAAMPPPPRMNQAGRQAAAALPPPPRMNQRATQTADTLPPPPRMNQTATQTATAMPPPPRMNQTATQTATALPPPPAAQATTQTATGMPPPPAAQAATRTATALPPPPAGNAAPAPQPAGQVPPDYIPPDPFLHWVMDPSQRSEPMTKVLLAFRQNACVLYEAELPGILRDYGLAENDAADIADLLETDGFLEFDGPSAYLSSLLCGAHGLHPRDLIGRSEALLTYIEDSGCRLEESAPTEVALADAGFDVEQVRELVDILRNDGHVDLITAPNGAAEVIATTEFCGY